MNLKAEKSMKEMLEYLQTHGEEGMDTASMNQLLQEFLNEAPEISDEECALDYLEQAYQAPTAASARKFVQKALELEPDNLDALTFDAKLNTKNDVELLDKLSALIEQGDRQMEQENYFEESTGEFWLILETRPYMRLRYLYMETMIQCGMFRRAIREGQRLMELCSNDNMGVRYDLMHLYAHLEDLDSALALKNSNALNENDSQMLMCMAALYFKLGQLDESLAQLKKLHKLNPDTKRFLKLLTDHDVDAICQSVCDEGYRPCTLEEFAHEFMAYDYLFINISAFSDWAYRKLRNTRSTKTAAKSKK